MARSYDGAGNASAREKVEQSVQHEKDRNKKIEFGVIIGAIAIAGLSVVVNTGKCIGAAGATKTYNEQRVEAEATLEQLNANLQDPSAQNYVYKDPTVGNMTETGQAIAMMQNQIISASNTYNNQSAGTNADISGMNMNTGSDMHTSTGSRTGGAVTLDPEDFAPTDAAPSESTTPPSETTKEDTVTASPDNSSDSGYEYTPISDFNNTQITNDASTPSATNAAPVVVSDGRDLAQLIQDFKKNYFAQQITSVDDVPNTQCTAWSWYGYWEFSGTYDYSVNEVPQMNAVWTCYEPSDVTHVRPLAFVTAVYSESTKKFSNPTAYYTKYYVNAAEGQKNQFGPQSVSNNSTNNSTNNSNTVMLQPDGTGSNVPGSENEYHLNIKEDDATNNSSSSNGDVILEPDTGNTANQNTTTPSTGATTNQTTTPAADTTQPSNPSGAAVWNPGGGANTNSGNNTSGTGTWNSSSGSQGSGTWNSGTNSSGNSGSSGAWVPSN